MKCGWTAAALALMFFPLVAAAQDENPYKKAKVGDYATFKMTTKIAGFSVEGTVTQTVTAKDDKEVTVKTTGKVNNMDIPGNEQKIDLSKPLDPTQATNLPLGKEAKIDKLKNGDETLKLAGKEFKCKWETYKVKLNQMGMDLEAQMKVWMSKDVNIPMVKMEMSMEVMGMKMEMVMELIENGSGKGDK